MPDSYEGPEPEAIREVLRGLGHSIGEQIPSGWGFTLMIFSFGDGGAMTYISNAERATMLDAMREFIWRLESPPRHG